jgi:hypothetical protein
MATTTNYGWTTPDDTALVKDGAAAIRTLGTSVDTTTKALNPSTTLGDIEYRSSTANTNTRLGIGSTGQVLTVAAGVPSWASAASSIPANAVARVAANQSTTSTSYTDLATSGPEVTVTTGTRALVIVTATSSHEGTGGEAFMAYDVSGATTVSATDNTCLRFRFYSGFRANRASSASAITLTAGSNTFTAKYKSTDAGGGNVTATFNEREIFVINLA